MKIRSIMLLAAVTAILAAPLVAQTHESDCGISDRVVTVIGDGESTSTIYIDDRGYNTTNSVPPEVMGPAHDVFAETPYGRVPLDSESGDAGGVWVYIENGSEPGLQVSENHVILGENSNAVAITFEDPCYGFEGKAKNTHALEDADLIVL